MGMRYEQGDNMGVTSYGAKVFSSGNACFVSDQGAKIYGSGNWTSWTSGYITNSVEPSIYSDRDVKKNIHYGGDERFEALLGKLQPVSYELIDSPGPRHLGLIAQDVEKAMQECGIRRQEFAGLARHRHRARDAADKKRYDYFIGYGELIPLLIAEAQRTRKRLEALEAREG